MKECRCGLDCPLCDDCENAVCECECYLERDEDDDMDYYDGGY